MKGLIVFCDILGYQNFLANNSATDSAIKVLDIITSTPKAVKSTFNTIWEKNFTMAGTVDEIPEKLEHLVFSDTIVLMLPHPETYDDSWRYRAIAYITFFSSHLKEKMFRDGLPLRCIIHEGDFISRESCLAGTAIVEAYQLVESFELSALVFSPTLGENILELQKTAPIFLKENFEQFFVQYLTPIKGGTEKKFLHYNWLHPSKESLVQDPYSFVLKSFWAHKKDCSSSVDGKVAATAKLVRKLSFLHQDYEQAKK